MIKESFIRVSADIAKRASVLSVKLNASKPEIFIVGGVGFMIAGAIAACAVTHKAEDILEEHQEKIEALKEKKEKEESYSDKEYRKDVTRTYVKTCVGVAKVYAIPAAAEALGTASILYGTKLFRAEQAAILASYGTLQTAFGNYRGRVKEVLGDEIEENLFNGTAEIERYEKDDDGKKKKKTYKFVDPILDPYTFIFEEVTAPSLWVPSASTNRMNVVAIQAEANRMLEANGYLFLNDVLRMLGMKETEISRKVGWIKHPSDQPYVVGDSEGFVDFGLFRGGDQLASARYEFLNGDEPSFTLHFNVQGVIIDKFEAAATRAF